MIRKKLLQILSPEEISFYNSKNTLFCEIQGQNEWITMRMYKYCAKWQSDRLIFSFRCTRLYFGKILNLKNLNAAGSLR